MKAIFTSMRKTGEIIITQIDILLPSSYWCAMYTISSICNMCAKVSNGSFFLIYSGRLLVRIVAVPLRYVQVILIPWFFFYSILIISFDWKSHGSFTCDVKQEKFASICIRNRTNMSSHTGVWRRHVWAREYCWVVETERAQYVMRLSFRWNDVGWEILALRSDFFKLL